MARAREVAAGTCMGKTRSGGSVLHVTRNTGRSIFRLLMIDGVSPAPTRRFGPPLPREGAGEGEGVAIFHDGPPADVAPRSAPRRASGDIGCYVPITLSDPLQLDAAAHREAASGGAHRAHRQAGALLPPLVVAGTDRRVRAGRRARWSDRREFF